MADLPPIQVTNNTSATIELFDVYQQAAGDAGPTATTPVTYTSLGTVAAGATAIIKTLHASNHIVAMQSGTLSDPTGGTQSHFPVKVIAVLSFTKDRDFSVEKADKDAMEQTFRFIRYVSANPGSALATQFLAALNSDAQATAVNTFFAASTSFKTCTMATWTAVTAWQSDFLSAWQGSYYLYDASDDLKVMKLVAGVSITLSGDDVQAQLWMADADGKWTMDSAHTPLKIVAGELSEPTPTEGMSVSLKPVWMNAVQSGATNEVSATTVIAPALAGTVNGTKVLGNFKKMATPPAGSSASLSSVGAWLMQNINVSTLISAGMLFIMFKQWQQSKNTEADKTIQKDQADGADPNRMQNDVEMVQANVDRVRLNLEPTDKQPSFKNLAQNEAAARAEQAKADVQQQVEQQQNALETVLEEAPASPQTDAVATSLQNASDNADSGNVVEAWADLKETDTNLQELVTTHEASLSAEAKADVQAIQHDIKASADKAQAEQKAEQEQQENRDKKADDPVNDDDVADPHSEPMGFPGGE